MWHTSLHRARNRLRNQLQGVPCGHLVCRGLPLRFALRQRALQGEPDWRPDERAVLVGD